MYTTASKDVRQVLSSGWSGLCNKYQRYNQLSEYEYSRLRREEKEELDELRRDICLWEFDKVESPALRLSKFVHIGDNSKRHECDAVVKVSQRSQRKLDQLIEEFQFDHGTPDEIRFMLKLQGRLIVNHTGGVLENAGLCLHPHAGVPYIPGSAVKGVARHAAWCNWANAQDANNKVMSEACALKTALSFGYPTNDKKLDKYCAQQWPQWFGEQGALSTFAGLFAFMPAFPSQSLALITDIVTCHHAEYYNGKQQKPYNNESPNPQFFPAVESGSMFTFIVRPLPRCKQILASRKDVSMSFADLCAFVEQSLREAAEEYGFGSKTSNGYGWFAVDIDEENSIAEAKANQIERAEAKLQAEKVKADEERERLERIRVQTALASLSPIERAEYEINDWDDNKWRTVLSQIKIFDSLDTEIKSVVVRKLTDEYSELWEQLKQTAQQGKKKDKKTAQEIRDAIYVIAKNHNPRIKMP